MQLYERVDLICEVESNPAPSYRWKLNSTRIYDYQNLTIYSMNYDSYGTYTCEASLKDFPVAIVSTKLVRPGAPIIEAESKQFAYYGSDSAIEVLIEAEPKADV